MSPNKIKQKLLGALLVILGIAVIAVGGPKGDGTVSIAVIIPLGMWMIVSKEEL